MARLSALVNRNNRASSSLLKKFLSRGLPVDVPSTLPQPLPQPLPQQPSLRSCMKQLRPPAQSKSSGIIHVRLQTCPSCSPVDKVFTDEIQGIVCYRSDTGEIICEGRDEGPYFSPPYDSVGLPENRTSSFSKVPDSNDDRCDLWVIEYMGSVFCEGRDEG